MLIFFDDILIYSRTWEEHLQHLEEVLGILESESLMPKNLNANLVWQSCCILGTSLAQME